MAPPPQDHANDAAGRRPFSFQIPPDPAHPPPTIASEQAAQAGHEQREWSGYPEQRFSYIDTPIDENTQTFDDERQAAVLEEARRRYGELNPPSQSATPQPQPAQHPVIQQASPPAPDTAFPPEKQGIGRVPSAYQQPPPAQQHPAFSAPVANAPHQQHPALSAVAHNAAQQSYTQSPPQEPLSPGPLPLKDERDFPQAHKPPQRTTAIQPDSQPPVFQPPPNSHFSVYSAHGGVHATAAKPSPAGLFRHGLCACPGSDMGTCCTGIFCPCVLYSRLQYRLSKRSKRSDPTDLLGWDKCDSACIGFATLSVCGLCGILAGIARGRVRRAYGIEGSTSSDCIEGCCCCCCAVIQGEREVHAREEDGNGTAGRRQVDPYQKHPSMAYQPNGA